MYTKENLKWKGELSYLTLKSCVWVIVFEGTWNVGFLHKEGFTLVKGPVILLRPYFSDELAELCFQQNPHIPQCTSMGMLCTKHNKLIDILIRGMND